jgi:hypothetical protein
VTAAPLATSIRSPWRVKTVIMAGYPLGCHATRPGGVAWAAGGPQLRRPLPVSGGLGVGQLQVEQAHDLVTGLLVEGAEHAGQPVDGPDGLTRRRDGGDAIGLGAGTAAGVVASIGGSLWERGRTSNDVRPWRLLVGDQLALAGHVDAVNLLAGAAGAAAVEAVRQVAPPARQDRAAGQSPPRVPKRDLISTMSVLLEQRRLRIPRSLPIADLLTKELQEFKRTVTKVGNDTYAAERDQHDDMVLALALACWYWEWVSTRFERASARHQQRAAARAVAEERAGRLASR